MAKIETRLGLTNITKRLAYHYLCRGFGNYPIDHPQYDGVNVGQLYPWEKDGGGIKVTFVRKGRRVRWVEFGIRFGGGGGDPAVFEMGGK